MPYKLKLRTLSPVHIGNGNKISDFEYFVHSNWYYKLNTDRCFNFVFDKVPNSMDKFNDWIEGKSDQISTYGQTKPKDSFSLNIFSFIKDYLRNTSLAEELKTKVVNDLDFHHYKMPTNITPKKEVAAALKTARNELYIPGSTLKGLIRTALLADILSIQKDKSHLYGNITTYANGIKNDKLEKAKKEFYAELDEDYLYSGYEYFDKRMNKRIFQSGDAKYDLMKFIHITDTNSISCQKGGRLVEPNLFLPNKNAQSQVPFIEAIKEEIEFTARISIDINYLKSLKNNNIQDEKGNRIWIDFHEIFNEVFGLDVKNVNENHIIKSIETALLHHNKKILAIDSSWLSKTHENEMKVLKKFTIEQNEKIPANSFKLGWGTGFPGMTVMTSLMEDDEVKKAYEASLKKLKIIKSDKSKIDEFPISKRLEKMGNGEPAPLGWVEFKFEKL